MNKRYKHKRTGVVVTYFKPLDKYLIPGDAYLPTWMVENSCDWELVAEKEYVKLILE